MINKNITKQKIQKKTSKIDELVQIETLATDNGRNVYLMKIANIPIIPYVAQSYANRVATYMKTVVNAVIQKFNANRNLTGKDLVKIEQLTTKEGTYYLITIADLYLRGYIDGFESAVHANFMVTVVNEIIKQVSV